MHAHRSDAQFDRRRPLGFALRLRLVARGGRGLLRAPSQDVDRHGGFPATGTGFVAGAVAYTATIFGMFSPGVIAATTAVAAGAMLAMLADTMIPEAFEEAHEIAGLVTVVGFLAAFVLSKVAGVS